jgi:hypothetical protein
MSIQRNTTAILQHDASPFTTMFNDVLQGIKHTGALGVYCYLASKPAGWVIRKEELQAHFNCGRDHIQTCINFLKRLGVLVVTPRKSENGKYNGCDWTLLRHIPSDCTIVSEERETRTADNTASGNPPPINKKKDLEIKDLNKHIGQKDNFGLAEMLDDNPHNIDPPLLKQWLVNRKRWPVSRVSWQRLNRVLSELLQKGIKPYDAFEAMVANCWRSLEVKYFEQEFKLKKQTKPMADLDSTAWAENLDSDWGLPE